MPRRYFLPPVSGGGNQTALIGRLLAPVRRVKQQSADQRRKNNRAENESIIPFQPGFGFDDR
jgi:hypothetical protein